MTDNRTIVFCGRKEAESICRRYAVPRVLSISDPKTPYPQVAGISATLRLRFYDVDASSREYQAVTPDQVAAIIGFMSGARRAATLVHCEAGISRSAAATMIGHYLLTGSEKEAAGRTRDSRDGPMRDYIRPNRLILLYADRILRSKLRKGSG